MASLADLVQMVETYAQQTLKESYPNLDLTPGSPEMDTTIGPMMELLLPFIRKINRWDINQNLDNYDIILESDLDMYAKSNHFEERRLGSPASGPVTVSFRNVPEGQNLVIQSGFMVQATSKNLNFYVVTPVTFTPDDIVQYYNINTFMYDIPLTVQCDTNGVVGNVDPGAINKIVTPIDGAVSVTNTTKFSNGVDKETNAQFVQRLKTDYLSKISGMTYGYQKEVLDNFAKVTGIYVAGKNDPLMMRDVLDVVGVGPTHIGGAVDLYLQGTDPKLLSFQVQMTGNNFLLTQKPVVAISSVKNLTKNTTLSAPSYALKYLDDAKAGTTNEIAYVRILSGATNGDSVQINFTYKDLGTSGQPTVSATQTNTYNMQAITIPSDPVIGIASVTDDTRNTTLTPSQFTYTIGDMSLKGTTRQKSSIAITDGFVSGDFLTVQYSQEDLITQVQNYYIAKRFAASDVLARMAVAKHLYIWMRVKAKDGATIGDIEQEYINVVVNDYVNSIPMGGVIEESVLVDSLHSNPQTSKFIDYVSLPMISMYVDSAGTDPIVQGRHSTAIPLNPNEYPVVQWCQVDPITDYNG